MPRLNVDIPDALYKRLVIERDKQDRSQRAIATIALEQYFAALDKEREARDAA